MGGEQIFINGSCDKRQPHGGGIEGCVEWYAEGHALYLNVRNGRRTRNRGSRNESKHVEGMLAVKEDAGVATRRGTLYSLFRK
jgi:hypothetical protein